MEIVNSGVYPIYEITRHSAELEHIAVREQGDEGSGYTRDREAAGSM